MEGCQFIAAILANGTKVYTEHRTYNILQWWLNWFSFTPVSDGPTTIGFQFSAWCYSPVWLRVHQPVKPPVAPAAQYPLGI